VGFSGFSEASLTFETVALATLCASVDAQPESLTLLLEYVQTRGRFQHKVAASSLQISIFGSLYLILLFKHGERS